MTRKRRLSMESLEHRLVLDGVGLSDLATSKDWQSVIVALNDNVGNPEAVAKGFVSLHGGQLGHVYQHAVKGFSAQLPAAALEALQKNPLVKRIEPDLVMSAFADDVQVLPTGVNRIDADLNPVAKIDGVDGINERVDVDVAIIDSGIDADHPDLNVVGGYNATGGSTSRWDDANGHGTHVAGIVGALDNGVGVVGVAPGARLWAVRVLGANGSGTLSGIIKGIDWVTANADTIEVANMSLGGQGYSTTYRQAIQNSVNKGVVYVVAAGNEYRDILGGDLAFGTSDDTIPAAYPEVATISAIADSDGQPGGLGAASPGFGYLDDTFADFSNFSNSDGDNKSWYDTNNYGVISPGLGIDLMMPGVDILSTYMGGGYATASGTSMAAPHAAGLAALYIAEHGRAGDEIGVKAIRQALIDGGRCWWSDEGLKVPDPEHPYWNTDSPDKHMENLGWAGPSISVAPNAGLVTTESGGWDTFSVQLNTRPTADVTISVSSLDTTEGAVSPAVLNFTTLNWNVRQLVTVTGVPDSAMDGNQVYTIRVASLSSQDVHYQQLHTDVRVVNRDNGQGDNLPYVTITATDQPTAAEDGSVNGLFTVTRSGSTAGELTVYYTVSGSADSVDYQPLLASPVTIPVNEASAAIMVSAVNDEELEGDETVILSLVEHDSYIVGSLS